jgi:hypothetical protein
LGDTGRVWSARWTVKRGAKTRRQKLFDIIKNTLIKSLNKSKVYRDLIFPAGDYPFPHKIGERLRSPAKNLEGNVSKAKYAGTEGGESAWIAYYIETDTGETIQRPSAELEKVGQRYKDHFPSKPPEIAFFSLLSIIISEMAICILSI